MTAHSDWEKIHCQKQRHYRVRFFLNPFREIRREMAHPVAILQPMQGTTMLFSAFRWSHPPLCLPRTLSEPLPLNPCNVTKQEKNISCVLKIQQVIICSWALQSKITKLLLKSKQKYRTIRSATHDQLFKQLTSQEQVPVTLLLVQTVTLHFLNYQLFWNFVVWSQCSQPFVTGCVINTHPLPYSPSSLLASQPKCFGQAGWHGMSIGWCCQKNPRSSCASTFSDSIGKKSVRFHHRELWIEPTSPICV